MRQTIAPFVQFTKLETCQIKSNAHTKGVKGNKIRSWKIRTPRNVDTRLVFPRLQKACSFLGPCQTLASDLGVLFVGKMVKDLLALCSIEKHQTASRKPSINGVVGRFPMVIIKSGKWIMLIIDRPTLDKQTLQR